MGYILDLEAFRRQRASQTEDAEFDRHMEQAEQALLPAATTAWERVARASARVFDPDDSARTVEQALRRFRKADAQVALLAFARMVADADPEGLEDLRHRFLEAFVIAHHEGIR